MSWTQLLKIPDVKSGQITTDDNGSAVVSFSSPFADNNYAIILTPVNQASTSHYVENIGDGGFSIKGDGNKTYLWVATPCTEPIDQSTQGPKQIIQIKKFSNPLI